MQMTAEGEVTLYGRTLTGGDLLRRVGRLEQVAGIEPFVFDDGHARGVRALRVRTGTGFSFTVIPDRALDIDATEYNGMALAWSSPTGVVGPWYREPEGEGWLRSFHGGLLVTCGLSNVGVPSAKDGEPLGLHGRISSIPSSNVTYDAFWDTEGCRLELSGRARETSVFGPNLVLERRISARVGSSWLQIEDTVRNDSFSSTPLMLLYHLNLGWPLLDESSRLIGPGASGEAPEPRDADAAEGLKSWDRFDAPVPGFRERVFYHRPEADDEGWTEARLENPELAGGVAFRVRFRPEELPEFVQWTMIGEGTYVVGFEPATCRVGGYEAERAAGRVVDLGPRETRRFGLQIGVDSLPSSANAR
jgi:hypothetical protein